MAAAEKKERTLTPTRVVRIQRKNGKVIQDCDVYIGRAQYQGGWSLPASPWANPFRANSDRKISVHDVCLKYEEYLLARPQLLVKLPDLRGKTLGCWCIRALCSTCGRDPKACKHFQCHGEVLAKHADKSPPKKQPGGLK